MRAPHLQTRQRARTCEGGWLTARARAVHRPARLAEQIALGYHEKEQLQQLLTKYECTGVCKGASCQCKQKKK